MPKLTGKVLMVQLDATVALTFSAAVFEAAKTDPDAANKEAEMHSRDNCFLFNIKFSFN